MKLTKLELSGFKSFADTVKLDLRGRGHRHRRPQRLRQVERLRCRPLGAGRAVGAPASRRQDGGRDLPGRRHAAPGERHRGLPLPRQHRRRPSDRVPRGGDHPAALALGHSEYLLNNAPVRLRDIQDLLRGTGIGSDAGVVIEAKMIDLLLSDRAEERRSLFEEAAGIGLYRDRKHSTERRLEETTATCSGWRTCSTRCSPRSAAWPGRRARPNGTPSSPRRNSRCSSPSRAACSIAWPNRPPA